MKHRHLEIGLEVVYFGADNKKHKATITQVITQDCARVESEDGNHSAIAHYAENGAVNTFQFPPDAAAMAGAGKPKPAGAPASAKAEPQ